MAPRKAKSGRRTKRNTLLAAFDAIVIEGGLLQPDVLAQVAAATASGQSEADYGLDPKERLRDVIQTKFTLAQSLYARFLGSDKGNAATRRFLSSLIGQVFEFSDLAETSPAAIGDRNFPIGHHALSGRVPIVFAPAGSLDEALPPFGDEGRRRSAAQLLQEYLNAAEGSLWGLVCDATRLRLYRDSVALTRPAYIEVDLARMFDADAPRIADFAALWLLIHSSRFGRTGAPPTDCALERWREEGKEQGATARERLRDGVEAALLELGRGFLEHPGNVAVKAELSGGRFSPQDYLQALLRVVYRFIFVFTAEDRDVLHLPPPNDGSDYERWRQAKTIYAQGYSVARLRERAAKRQSRDRHGDGWDGIKILFHALTRGEKRLALPALGGLFGPNGARELNDCALSNVRLHEAIFRLAWIRTEAGLERVNWRDMETEELGSVYESLLELSPRLGGAEGFAFVESKGNERKTTASYYTHDSLVQALLDETFDPLVRESVKDKAPDEAVEALLSLRIVDPACGSGHFLLAAARRLARKIVELKNPGAPSPSEFRHWLREAARRCLFGVDRNPMAVDLAKVALWIETVEPGKPLTFLDGHIRCGDSLLGVYDLGALQHGVPDEAFKPLTGDDKLAAREWGRRNRAERGARSQAQLSLFGPPKSLIDSIRAVEAAEENVLEDVEAKARAFRSMLAGPERYAFEVACDLYIAAFLLPKTSPPGKHAGEAQSFVPTSRDIWDKLAGGRSLGLIKAHAVDAAKEARAFHWPLEFPQVFFPPAGKRAGFDLAIGNPPWDRIKLQEKEFFASRAPEIASARNKAARARLIAALRNAPTDSAERGVYDAFVIAKRLSEASSMFARVPADSGGRFPLAGTGDVNTFALFTELFATQSLFVAMIVPSELATSDTTKELFGHLIDSGRLRSMYDFQTGRGFFDRIGHARFKFLLVMLGGVRDEADPEIRVATFLRTNADIHDASRFFTLLRSDFHQFNPNTKTSPIFRTKADADLMRDLYSRFPVIVEESKGASGNQWNIEFSRLFDMSGDSGIFRTAVELQMAGATRTGADWEAPEEALKCDVKPGRWIPLYEAKMIHHFDHRWATYVAGISANIDDIEPRDSTGTEKVDPQFEPCPRYWVLVNEVTARLASKGWTRQWLMGWRDICRATDERTVIAGAIPLSGCGDKFLLMMPETSNALRGALLATMSTLTFDYIARQKLGGTSLKYFVMKQLVAPPPSVFNTAELAFIVPRVLELTYTSHSMKPLAEDLGYTGLPFVWNEDRRALLRAELDAYIAKLYCLNRDQLRYILDPEDVMGRGYPSETFRGLKKNEIAKYHEYRTARLVLDAWDRMDRGEL